MKSDRNPESSNQSIYPAVNQKTKKQNYSLEPESKGRSSRLSSIINLASNCLVESPSRRSSNPDTMPDGAGTKAGIAGGNVTTDSAPTATLADVGRRVEVEGKGQVSTHPACCPCHLHAVVLISCRGTEGRAGVRGASPPTVTYIQTDSSLVTNKHTYASSFIDSALTCCCVAHVHPTVLLSPLLFTQQHLPCVVCTRSIRRDMCVCVCVWMYACAFAHNPHGFKSCPVHVGSADAYLACASGFVYLHGRGY
jgi:hypothetical protein